MAYIDEVLADSPAGYWRLGESSGTTAADSSGNGRSGTYVGSTRLVLGQAGALVGEANTAVSGTGSGSVETTLTNANVPAQGPLTMECWFKGSTAAVGNLMSIRRSSGTVGSEFSGSYVAVLSNGKLYSEQVLSNGTVGASFTSANSICDGAWHHIAVTFPGAGGTNLIYLDGAAIGSYTGQSINLLSTSTYVLGAWLSGGVPLASGHLLDECAVYPTVLSAARIAQHYGAGLGPGIQSVAPSAGGPGGGEQLTITGRATSFTGTPTVTIGGVAATGVTVLSPTSLTCIAPAGTPGVKTVEVVSGGTTYTLPGGYTYRGPYVREVLADSPVGYWRLGEPSGTLAWDASGNGYVGTYAGSTPLTRGSAGGLTGDPDTAVTGTTSGYVATGLTAGTFGSGGPLTMECWFKAPSASTGFSALIGVRNTGDYQGLILYTNATTGRPSVEHYGTSSSLLTGPSSVCDGKWHHLVVTVDATTVTLYVDMVAVATTPKRSPSVNAAREWRLGGLQNSSAILQSGHQLDECAIYSGVLSTSRIAAHYFAGLDSRRFGAITATGAVWAQASSSDVFPSFVTLTASGAVITTAAWQMAAAADLTATVTVTTPRAAGIKRGWALIDASGSLGAPGAAVFAGASAITVSTTLGSPGWRERVGYTTIPATLDFTARFWKAIPVGPARQPVPSRVTAPGGIRAAAQVTRGARRIPPTPARDRV